MERNSLQGTTRIGIGSNFIQYFLDDLFLVVKDVNFASYTDDSTIYQSGRNVNDVINDLQLSAEKLFCWFSDNQMKGNTGRGYYRNLIWESVLTSVLTSCFVF